MRRITLSAPCLVLQYFSKLSQNDIIFGEKLVNIKCVSSFLYNFYLKYFSFYEELRDI